MDTIHVSVLYGEEEILKMTKVPVPIFKTMASVNNTMLDTLPYKEEFIKVNKLKPCLNGSDVHCTRTLKGVCDTCEHNVPKRLAEFTITEYLQSQITNSLLVIRNLKKLEEVRLAKIEEVFKNRLARANKYYVDTLEELSHVQVQRFILKVMFDIDRLLTYQLIVEDDFENAIAPVRIRESVSMWESEELKEYLKQ